MSNPPLIREKIGQYTLLNRLPDATNITTFQASQKKPVRTVLLKTLKITPEHQPDFSQVFIRQAQRIAQLHHPNLLPVYDFGLDDDVAFVVLRYMPQATPLADLLAEPWPVDRALAVVEQLAAVLDYSAAAGLLHSRLSTGNILIEGEQFFLSELGLAELAAGDDIKIEVAQQRPDVTALAAVTFELLTGQPPQPQAAPSALNPALSPALDAVLLAALTPAAKQYGSGRALAQALNRAAGRTTAPAEAQPPLANQPDYAQLYASPTPASSRFSPVEVILMTILGIGTLCGLAGAVLSLTGDMSQATDVAMLPACLGPVFAGISAIGMMLYRDRRRDASAWLAGGIGLWYVGIILFGLGGFAVMPTAGQTAVSTLGYSLVLCFGPGVLLATAGLLAYWRDFRRSGAANAAARSGASPAATAADAADAADSTDSNQPPATDNAEATASSAVNLDDKLARAAEYRRHIERLIDRNADGPFADQLAPIKDSLRRWETHLRQLVLRRQNFISDHIIQRDLREAPAAITRLQAQLETETDPQVQQELQETLDSYQTHHRQLQTLQRLARRIELDIDETLARIGTIYSQLQILGARDADRLRAQRLSANINEQTHRLDDLLTAVDEVHSESSQS